MSHTVKELLSIDEEAALKLLKAKIDPLKLSPGAEEKFFNMFIQAFSPKNSHQSNINWGDVEPLTDEEMIPYDKLAEPTDPKALLDQLVVIKLNGGLGTTMGCTYPKSLITLNNDKTFFDIVVDQVKEFNEKYNTSIPLVLMHSFYTDDLMKSSISKVQGLEVRTYLQNRFPRIYADTLEPVPTKQDDDNSMWNPPGHGDVFHCLRDSGLLDELLERGKHYIMISNIDNLGARIDLKILNKIVTDNVPYCSETTIKTPEEWKGGLPIKYKGHLHLLETAQVPKEHMNDFIQFSYFNCNNLWVDLRALKESLSNGSLKLDVIKNNKIYNGKPIIQLEAASGSVIGSFPRAIAIKVPRKRFIPVKSCNELLLIRSDLWLEHGTELLVNERRTVPGLPSVNLSKNYQHVQEFEKRIPYPVSLYNLVSLKVEGEVKFGKNVSLEGKVEIVVPEGETITIPDGKHLKDIIVTSQNQL